MPPPPQLYSKLVDDVKGMKIGIPRDYFGEGLDGEVKDAVLAAAKQLAYHRLYLQGFEIIGIIVTGA